MNKLKKSIVYIDGENFVHRAVELLGKNHDRNDLIGLNIRTFIEKLLRNNSFIEIKYYTTKVRFAGQPAKTHAKLKDVVDFNSKWLSRLASQKVEIIRAGILRSRETKPCPKCGKILGYFVEKGVDVKLAVDLIEGALDPAVASMYVLSSDLDLLPAIHVAKQKKKIVYIASADAANAALVATFSKTLTFTGQDIKEAKSHA